MKERETKLKNFIGKKKKIKASVLRDFILNDLGYENFNAGKIKNKFPNLVIEKDTKTGVKTKPLTKEEIIKIKDSFDLPEGEKWDFKRYKNGLNSEKYPNLVGRIINRLADPKKYTIAADFFPNVLNTFEVPGLPLPSEEISIPFIRAVI